MGAIKPQQVATVVSEALYFTSPDFKRLDDCIVSVLKIKFSQSEEFSYEYCEQYISIIGIELFSKKDLASKDGIDLPYEIKEEDDAYYIRFNDQPEAQYLLKLQAESPEAFESFCSTVLEKLGGQANVHGGKDDKGVDFSGINLRLNNMPVNSTIGSRIAVIGQAKRYKDGNLVKLKDLREFIGCSVERLDFYRRTRSDQFGTMQPVILAFWTTSDFHIEAREFAMKMGVWYLNGIALAQLAIRLGIEISN